MTHHARLNLVMFITIAGLAVFLYFRPQSLDIHKYPLSTSSIEAVQNLRIVRQQQEIALKQLDNHWYLVKPVQARADERKIAEILEILTVSSNQRLPLADLERFGLDQPNVRLYLNNEYFGFGGFAPTTHQQYVATGDQVYLISPRYVLALPSNASDLINPQLLASDEIPVKFELNHLTVEFQNENWHTAMQRSDEALDEATIKHWIQLWQTAHARELILEQALGADFVVKGFINIALQNGQEINLRILQNEFSLVLLRVNGGFGYQFPIDAGQQLVDPHRIKSNQILPEN
ncbi:MAG: DUF4340 domain-containing protein [Nitrosomonas sp.]|jgi:hypothetical protein|uniref:DUF4340 domain-containing protein n=1 Tax=Nitrosomonas sp. TaxID=42353 RepID=UPI002731F34D|nr:DUF4340 domain-containing protein [Nitrosomonas sp.]MDP1550672.1 DUF4340 domain-containing protein [Nitrosomonas sp.]MDP1933338.1 DUF4340 domain-containing protein [Nitrosomonas sp.]MDP3280303.1 DUF4340 domain-containing protein [Nitrosomonas sp.]MDP3663631.1 DUF4340 domain-containing protein [Nitrosomonas sp.]MDZ4105525.1 DUF4340 domain-containing protein [Nitrosomonas sp.]